MSIPKITNQLIAREDATLKTLASNGVPQMLGIKDVATSVSRASGNVDDFLFASQSLKRHIASGSIVPDSFAGRGIAQFNASRLPGLVEMITGKSPVPVAAAPKSLPAITPAAAAQQLGQAVIGLASHPAASVRQPLQAGIAQSISAAAALKNCLRSDFQKLSSRAQLDFVSNGGRVVSESDANTVKPTDSLKIDRASFDALSNSAKSEFCRGGGRISEQEAPPVAPIATGSKTITRAQFNAHLDPQGKADFFRNGGKLNN